jgi:hypothetical protein
MNLRNISSASHAILLPVSAFIDDDSNHPSNTKENEGADVNNYDFGIIFASRPCSTIALVVVV